MDYKHRVPGNRRSAPRRQSRRDRAWLWLAAGGAAALIAIGWMIFGGSGDKPEEAEPPQTVILPAPAVAPSLPPDDAKAAAKSDPSAAKDKAGTKDAKAAKDAVKGAADGAPPQKAPPPKPPEPRFTFYKLLAEKEVFIPESEIRSIKREESQGKAAKTAGYQIQVGSFESQAEAEKVKQSLSKLKIHAKIEMIKAASGKDWFRVKIGPLTTMADVERTRNYLRSNGIDSVVQKETLP